MKRRALGRSGLTVSALGLGCMGMSEFYGPSDDAQNLRVLDRALELGIDFLDTADMYGPYINEELLGRFVKGRRDRLTIATKFGIVRAGDPAVRGVDNRPEYMRASVEGSLKRLGVDTIDLYYVHRVDREVPIEDTVGAMADLVRAGKIRAIGLSEVSGATLRRAASVHPIAAVQSEYSLWSREPEDAVLPACRELGIAFVAYSPLGRGMLTGALGAPEALDPNDFRRCIPRFHSDAYAANLPLVEVVRAVADKVGATPAQVALAWLLSRGDGVVPIPGTRRVQRLDENAGAVDLTLPADQLARLDLAFRPGVAAGERSSPQGMLLLNA
ncbi:MAG: aldo/keto reductase [Allosphingosinicella sp.]|uniref:aldo/keto reductase n=1 Tax=Allosphingosinicella sp. TaxID=2823234 RepID=UPI00395CB6F8